MWGAFFALQPPTSIHQSFHPKHQGLFPPHCWGQALGCSPGWGLTLPPRTPPPKSDSPLQAGPELWSLTTCPMPRRKFFSGSTWQWTLGQGAWAMGAAGLQAGGLLVPCTLPQRQLKIGWTPNEGWKQSEMGTGTGVLMGVLEGRRWQHREAEPETSGGACCPPALFLSLPPSLLPSPFPRLALQTHPNPQAELGAWSETSEAPPPRGPGSQAGKRLGRGGAGSANENAEIPGRGRDRPIRTRRPQGRSGSGLGERGSREGRDPSGVDQ